MADTGSAVRSSTEELDRFAVSRDLWPGGTLDLWQGRPPDRPARVLWPASESEVHTVLRQARDAGVAVVPFGAGSGVCGGARAQADAWVLDTKALDHIGEVDRERWSVTAGAGVNGQHLEDRLRAAGFTLGHSPSSIWCSTVGGWAAARGAGQFSSKYGVFEDMVLGLRAVAPERGPFGVGPAGDAPAEWMELLLGSEGTLAILTEVTMRVWPAPASRWLRGYRFADVATALGAMRRLMQGELHPSVVRLYDPVDTRIGGKTQPKRTPSEAGEGWLRGLLRRVDRLPAVRRRTLALPLALPGLVNRVFDRLASGCFVVAGWEGRDEVVEALAAEGHRVLCEHGDDLGPEPGERWYRSRHAVSYKLMPIFERGGFADTMEVAARWSDLEQVYGSVREALSRTTVVMAHMSHVYPEGGCIYFSFAGRGDPAVYRETWERALRAVLDSGGTCTHHHGVGQLKAGAAAEEAGPAVRGWRRLKDTLDPGGLLNPGRVYRDVPTRDPGPPPQLRPADGMLRTDARAPVEARHALAADAGLDVMWPFERLPGPPRWQREPWQTPWVEVAGEVDGARCRLGRGPRSAAGPDLRGWLAGQGDATATWAAVPVAERWMGEGRPTEPWRAAQTLLRSDLRPAVLTVSDGTLTVGFRGPAAAALGALATAWVPGGLTEVAYAPTVLPSGPLVPCAIDDPHLLHVTAHGCFRRPA